MIVFAKIVRGGHKLWRWLPKNPFPEWWDGEKWVREEKKVQVLAGRNCNFGLFRDKDWLWGGRWGSPGYFNDGVKSSSKKIVVFAKKRGRVNILWTWSKDDNWKDSLAIIALSIALSLNEIKSYVENKNWLWGGEGDWIP